MDVIGNEFVPMYAGVPPTIACGSGIQPCAFEPRRESSREGDWLTRNAKRVGMMRMGDVPLDGFSVPRGRQAQVGNPDERRWPLEGSLARLGVGIFFAVLAPVLIAAVGAPAAPPVTLVIVVDVAGVGLGCLFAGRRVARYMRVPRFTEFDGLIIEQWNRDRDEVTEYCVAIDDGQRPTAWAFMVSRELYLGLRPGMRVHVQINERRNRPINVEVVE